MLTGDPERGVCHSSLACPRGGLCWKEPGSGRSQRAVTLDGVPRLSALWVSRERNRDIKFCTERRFRFHSRASAYLTFLFSEKYVKSGLIYGPRAPSCPLRLWDIFTASQSPVMQSLQPHHDPADRPVLAAGLFSADQGVCRRQSSCQAWGRGRD